MRVFNQEPLHFAGVAGRLRFPGHSLTLIVKGTFDLLPEGVAKLAEKQAQLTGEEPYPDSDQGSLWYDLDFAYFKPRTDTMLVGKCHPPGGSATTCQVRFGVGKRLKTLTVIGNRESSLDAPTPYTEMEIRYERAAKNKRNPVGTEGQPNIEDPRDSAGPAGFGPIAQMWPARSPKAGTYGGSYMKDCWPWFAKDLDWGFFNAAPSDLQVEGYLRGDEDLYFENLHRRISQYRSQLPGLRVRCFLNEARGEPGASAKAPRDERFREVGMRLDTLWVDTEAEKLVLVWRGVTDVESEDFEEIADVFIVSEKLEEEAAPLAECQKQFCQRRLVKETEPEPEPEPHPSPPEDPAARAALEAELAEAEQLLRGDMQALGLDPDNPPEPSEEEKQLEALILAQLGIEEEPEEPALTRERVAQLAAAGESFEEKDLSGLDLSGLDLPGANFHQAVFVGTNLANAELSEARLSGANLADVDLSGANLSRANLSAADLPGANLIAADLTAAVLDEACLDAAQLRNASLNDVSAERTSFQKTQLMNASLCRTRMPGADFSRANLTKAEFRDAVLCAATFHFARGPEVDMQGADLTELRASDVCDFTNACFNECRAPDSTWQGAVLSGARFAAAELAAADFTSANLDGARLPAARCRTGVFRNASLRGVKLNRADLFEACFEKADLRGADLSVATCYGAEFLDARIDETDFALANLKLTKLAGQEKG